MPDWLDNLMKENPEGINLVSEDEYNRIKELNAELVEACKLALEKCAFPVGSMRAKEALQKAIMKSLSS